MASEIAREKEVKWIRQLGRPGMQSLSELLQFLSGIQYKHLEQLDAPMDIYRAQGAIVAYKDLLNLIEGAKNG